MIGFSLFNYFLEITIPIRGVIRNLRLYYKLVTPKLVTPITVH